MKNKKAVLPLLALVIIGILAVAAISYALDNGLISTASLTGSSTDGYIQVPYIPFLRCDLSATTRSYDKSIDSSNGQWLEIPDNTNGYSVRLLSPDSGISTPKRFEYYICPQKGITTNCDHKFSNQQHGGFDLNIGNIAYGSYVYATYESESFFSWPATSGGTYRITYQPYTLQRTDLLRGSGEILGSEGCNVPDAEWNSRLTSTFKGQVASDGIRKLQPNEVFNYFSGTITRMSEGNLDKGFYCIYSNGIANLYPIRPLTTASNTYQVVDVTGGSVGTQKCCSGDNLPDQTCVNGNWVSTAKAECGMLSPCEGNEWRNNYGTDKQVIRYNCVNSKCVAETKPVDCNKDSDCASTNLRCNLNTFKCEVASVGVDTPGTPVLATDETTCIKNGDKWIPKTTTNTGLLYGLIPFGGSTNVVEAHCESSSINWVFWLFIIGLIIILFMFGKPILMVIRGILHL